MKFQNCIFINFVTDAQTDEPKTICPFNFSKVGGIKSVNGRNYKLKIMCYNVEVKNCSRRDW